MPIVTCPGCGRTVKVPESYIGTKLKCSQCATSWVASPLEQDVSSEGEGKRFQEAGRSLRNVLDIIGWLTIVGGVISVLVALYISVATESIFPGFVSLLSAAGTFLIGYAILRVGPFLEHGSAFAVALARERPRSESGGPAPPTNPV